MTGFFTARATRWDYFVTGYDGDGAVHKAASAKAMGMSKSPKRAVELALENLRVAWLAVAPEFYYNEVGEPPTVRLYNSALYLVGEFQVR